MKLAAAPAATLALAGSAPSAAPVLGFDFGRHRLAWFDPATLTQLAGRKVSTASEGLCSWSFSPDRAQLAFSDCNGTLAFANVRAMKPAGSMYVTARLGSVDGLAWLRPDRLLATGHVDTATTLLVIDPARHRIVRRVELDRETWGRTVAGDRAVYLLAPWGAYAPAQIAVADADGNVRTATIDRITVGTVFDEGETDPTSHESGAGFAVDPDGGHAYVVSPDLLVADVDLSTLTVSYHGPTRTLAKFQDGPQRYARWLGDGLLAVSGADCRTTGTGSNRDSACTPYGLYVVDTRTWTVRTIDPAAEFFALAQDALLVARGNYLSKHETVALGFDGSQRYSVALGAREYLDVNGRFGYVCKDDRLVRVLDATTGTQLAAPRGHTCAALANGGSSDW
jgi:hypothetical protein